MHSKYVDEWMGLWHNKLHFLKPQYSGHPGTWLWGIQERNLSDPVEQANTQYFSMVSASIPASMVLLDFLPWFPSVMDYAGELIWCNKTVPSMTVTHTHTKRDDPGSKNFFHVLFHWKIPTLNVSMYSKVNIDLAQDRRPERRNLKYKKVGK